MGMNFLPEAPANGPARGCSSSSFSNTSPDFRYRMPKKTDRKQHQPASTQKPPGDMLP